jgi:hypothetical protein
MESAFPSQSLWKDTCAIFIGTDSVLLEVCNWEEWYCHWSLISTTSNILAIKLTASLRLLVRSHPLLFWVAAWLPLIVLAYHSLWTKCTPWFASLIERCWSTIEKASYVLTIRFRATSYWSRPWLQGLFGSICLKEWHFWPHSIIASIGDPYFEKWQLPLNFET